MQEELGEVHGMQGGKQERVCHLVSKLKLDSTSAMQRWEKK
jgi:hypothetical protein